MDHMMFKIGVFIGVVFLLAAAVTTLGILTSKSPMTNIRQDIAFTRQSASGSTDPLSEGLWLAQSESRTPADSNAGISKPPVGKPLIDVSVAPMKREIPSTSVVAPHSIFSGRSVHRWR